MAMINGVWGRFVRLWAGKSPGTRAAILIGVLILSPFLVIGLAVDLTSELVARADGTHRLTTNARWAVSLLAVLGVLLVLSAVSPRSPRTAADTAAIGVTPSPGIVAPSPTRAPDATIVEATSAPATPDRATPGPATPGPTGVAATSPDLTKSPSVVAAMFASLYGITFTDVPLSDGTVRKLGRDSTQLVIVELTGDPIKSMSVNGPIPGSGHGTDSTIGSVPGEESAVFGDPAGMTDWLIAQMALAGASDLDVTKRFGKVVAHLQWDATVLGIVSITADSGPIRSPVSVQSDQLFRSFRSPRR